MTQKQKKIEKNYHRKRGMYGGFALLPHSLLVKGTSSLSTYKVRHLYHLSDRSIVSLSEVIWQGQDTILLQFIDYI